MAIENILLIDDDEDDQEIFLMAVKEISPSLVCKCSSDAKQALQLLSSDEIDPDMIFLDLNMPGMNGQQFLEHLTADEKLSRIPVVIFTTSSDPVTIRSTKDSGAYDYITKPGNYDHLIDLLKPLIS